MNRARRHLARLMGLEGAEEVEPDPVFTAVVVSEGGVSRFSGPPLSEPVPAISQGPRRAIYEASPERGALERFICEVKSASGLPPAVP